MRIRGLWLTPLPFVLVDTYSTFAQQVLGTLLSQTTTSTKDDRTLKTCLAMLDLLAFRIARLRTISDIVKISTVPFETFVACHLAFRQALSSIRELAVLAFPFQLETDFSLSIQPAPPSPSRPTSRRRAVLPRSASTRLPSTASRLPSLPS